MPSLEKNNVKKVLEEVKRIERRIKQKCLKRNNSRKFNAQQKCGSFHTLDREFKQVKTSFQIFAQLLQRGHKGQ